MTAYILSLCTQVFSPIFSPGCLIQEQIQCTDYSTSFQIQSRKERGAGEIPLFSLYYQVKQHSSQSLHLCILSLVEQLNQKWKNDSSPSGMCWTVWLLLEQHCLDSQPMARRSNKNSQKNWSICSVCQQFMKIILSLNHFIHYITALIQQFCKSSSHTK